MSDPAWTRGFDLAFLKECAALFRAEFKPHTYGAFGVPKERDLADARAENSLIWVRGAEPGDPIQAVALAKAVARTMPHSDFAGRSAVMRPGDIFIKALAGSRAGKARIIESLATLEPDAIWIEGHVENWDLAAQLSTMGFDRAMTKVSAASDLKGLFVRGPIQILPAPLDPADAPGAKILKPRFLSGEERAAILGEIDAYGRAAFAQHYSGYNKRQSWTAFALRGYDADPGFIIKPSEMSRKWKDENPGRMGAACLDTSACGAFPAVWAALARIPAAGFQRVRFMRLAGGGGELTRHADITDPEAGTADGKIARLHIPIITAPECLFRSWNQEGVEHRLHMPPAALCYLDTRKPHAVINPAEVERIHLVVDAISGPGLRDWIGA